MTIGTIDTSRMSRTKAPACPVWPGVSTDVVDQVADHRRLRRARQQVGGEVVAQHRHAGHQHAGDHRLPAQRPGDPPERLPPVGAQVARGLERRRRHPVEAGEQRQDHVRHVAVDQAQDDGLGPAAEPVHVDLEQPAEAERPVDQPVGLEQVHPGQHPHHVADPERRDQGGEQEALPPAREPGRVVGHRVGDQQAQQAGHPDVHDGPDQGGTEEGVPADDVLPDVLELLDVPVVRVPDRHRLAQDRVDAAEQDRQHDVERRDQQEGDPDDAGDREQPATGCGSRRARPAQPPALNSCQMRWYAASAAGGQLQQRHPGRRSPSRSPPRWRGSPARTPCSTRDSGVNAVSGGW